MDNKKQIEEMFGFIDESPTCFQAAANLEKLLDGQGFVKLDEKNEWSIENGGKYYVNRNGSALIAFILPKKKPLGFHITAAHSDSPCFKIKEAPEIVVDKSYFKLNVEKYGGMIMSTWLDRALSVAGRVTVNEGNGLENKLININKDIAVIPNLAIHMNRDINKGVEYNPQTDMEPLLGEAMAEKSYKELLAKEAGVSDYNKILGTDLFLYNRDSCRFIGIDDEFIAGPRLDDLECAYIGMTALVNEEPDKYINICAVFDNEEVGSRTRQGADSTFLPDVLVRVCEKLGLSEEGYRRMLADSFLISADNAHALHPNRQEKADVTNRPVLNGGIVIKYDGSRRYATDSYSAAVMKNICDRAGVLYQTYENRSDIAGGSTLGNILTSQVSINMVDIGLAQLAMHSAMETAGAKDVDYLLKALREFYKD